MKRLRSVSILLLALIGVATVGWRWLLHTESGARWLLTQLQSASNAQLKIQSLNINLWLNLRTYEAVTRSLHI